MHSVCGVRHGTYPSILKKCVALHFTLGNKPTSTTYTVEGLPLEFSDSCRDLGVVVIHDISCTKLVDRLCSKAYSSLYLIKCSLSPSSSVFVRKKMYITFSEEPSILPLMLWYEMQDVLLLVKCLIDSPDNFTIQDYISFNSNPTRSSSQSKLSCKYSRTSVACHFYFSRVVRLWNSLPCIDLSKSYNLIKQEISDHFWFHFRNNFNPDNLCSFHIACPCSNCYIFSH